MQRWILTQPERSAISRECMKMAGADPCNRYCENFFSSVRQFQFFHLFKLSLGKGKI